MNNATAQPRDKVTLVKDGHTHAGTPRKAGDTIEVTARQKAFLIEQGLIAGGKTATKSTQPEA